MNRKKISPNHLLMGRRFTRIILAFAFAIFYVVGTMLAAPTTYAAGVPGGNISDPVVRAVDITKPAIVRIITTLSAHLTVDFPTNTGTAMSVKFPQTGQPYQMQLFGSGAFITSHGDILTADHVVNPPADQTNQFLYQLAAQDVANYFNTHSNTFVTANDVANALTDGTLRSQSQYATPTSTVYLSTDYTGPMNTTTLDGMPQGSHVDVQKILQERSFQNGGDTAIIHVNKDDTPSIKLGDSSNIEQQDQLTIIGFPGNGDLLTDTATSVTQAIDPATGFFTSSVNKVYVSALKQGPNKEPLIQIGGNVEEGDSGGPALDSNGNIVGVVSFFVNSNGAPEGTSFLQASSTAQKLIDGLQLNTTPGTFQTEWNNAFTQYTSGHWRPAEQAMQKLQNDYPDFHAIDPFLAYATTQASKEPTTTSITSISWLIAVVLVLIVIFVLVLLLFLARRRKNSQAALPIQPASYQPAYSGVGAWSETPEASNSGAMGKINDKDETDQNTGTITDRQSAQPQPMHSVPQIPAASYNAAPSGPPSTMPNQMSPWAPQAPQRPMASYNAAQSSPLPAMPNQMSPWPQPSGAPPYGQPLPYGQQPYNPGQPARPVQGGAYQPYPAQQRPYAPYPQAPAMPWPPAPGNTPYGAQQEAPTQRRQPSPTSGAAYGQSPQGYGAIPAQPQPTPAQSQPLPAYLTPNAPTTSEDATVRASQRSTPAPAETDRALEEKKNTASSMPTPAQDQTELPTIPNE